MNAARELSSTREAAIQALENELQQRRGEHARLNAQFQAGLAQQRRLEAQFENVQSQLKDVSSQLAQKCADEQIWLGRESDLQIRLRNQQDAIAKSSATLAAQEDEIKRSREQIEALQVTQSALCVKVQAITEQAQTLTESLAAESGHRTTAENKVTELVAHRTKLEQELAQRSRTQEQLRAELAEQQQRLEAQVQMYNVELGNLATRTKELETAQAALAELKHQHADVTTRVQSLTESLAAESGHRTAAENKVTELVAHRTKLEQELAQRSRAYDELRTELEAQIRTHNLELSRLAERTKELEIAQAALAEWKARHASLTGEVQFLTQSLTAESDRHATAEQIWTGRESELQNRIHTQLDQIAKSGAALTVRENEIKNARVKIEELQVLQSALCAQVQALTNQGEFAAKTIQEWQTKAARSETAVENVQRKLAGLHYSILDTSRISARLHRERSQKEQQNLIALQQLLASLAQTPLSLAQRGMLAELQTSVDGLKNSRGVAAKIEAFRVELPGLHDSHFCFAEVTESAFRAVRAAASAAGVAVQVTAAGITTGKLFGFAEHIHQLITLLAASPLNIMTGLNALDVRVEIEPKSPTFAKMTVRVSLTADNKALDLLAHLSSITAAAATLQSGEFTEAEFGLAAGWQLAQAMGGQTAMAAVSTNEVCLTLSLPIEIEPVPLPAEDHTDGAAACNGNGSRNGNVHAGENGSRNGNQNGNHPNQPRIGVENEL